MLTERICNSHPALTVAEPLESSAILEPDVISARALTFSVPLYLLT